MNAPVPMSAWRASASTAVMARRIEPADSLDFFPTPPWGTRSAISHVLPALGFRPLDLTKLSALDPCCGEGHMASVLAEYLGDVHASDIFDYGGNRQADFLNPYFTQQADWVFMNPPFNQALEFIFKALELARVGVAVLARASFSEGQERYRDLFNVRPPVLEGQFCERLAMHAGRWVVNGKSATSYSWFVWLKADRGTPGRWPKMLIPPVKKQLTRHDDWLRFRGCQDLPKEHPAMKIMADMARRAVPVERPAPATLSDIRAALEERLLV